MEDNSNTRVWPDEAAEEAFLTEARERGESATPGLVAASEAVEETETKGLPPLEELILRIPPEVRAMLDDLFRVKFTTVRRVPKKALKE